MSNLSNNLDDIDNGININDADKIIMHQVYTALRWKFMCKKCVVIGVQILKMVI
jgi:hypothetical protein